MTATGSVGLEPVVRRRRVRKLERGSGSRGDLRGFKARHRILDERREELVRKYPDQWVAFASNGTLVAADTVDDLIEKLDRKRLRGGDVAIRFMATTRRRMIL